MKFRLVGLFLLLFISACITEEPQGPAQVVSEEIVFVSGEIVILSGRILSQDEIFGTDHGFEISENEDFTNPLIVSLGEVSVPGRFIAQTDQLDIDKMYFARSFLEQDGSFVYGQTLSFTTLDPQINSYEPKVAEEGDEITIVGVGLTSDTKVFFGDREITDFTFSFESIITFPVPEMQNEFIIDISLVTQEKELTFEEPFEYIIGTWDFEGNFEDSEFDQGIMNRYLDINYVKDDTDLIVFNGLLDTDNQPGADTINKRFHRIDLQNFSSETVAFDGDFTVGGIQAYPYFGMGSLELIGFNQGDLILSDKIYAFQNNDVELITTAPEALYNAVCHNIDNRLYIYGGENGERDDNTTIYIYDIDADSWTNIQGFEIEISNDLPNWSHNGNSYFLASNKEIWEYDILADTWTVVSNYPGNIGDIGFASVLNDRVFIGMFDSSIDIFEINTTTFEKWRAKNSVIGGLDKSTIAMWTQDDKIFVLRNVRNEALNIFSLNPDNF